MFCRRPSIDTRVELVRKVFEHRSSDDVRMAVAEGVDRAPEASFHESTIRKRLLGLTGS